MQLGLTHQRGAIGVDSPGRIGGWFEGRGACGMYAGGSGVPGRAGVARAVVHPRRRAPDVKGAGHNQSLINNEIIIWTKANTKKVKC